MKFYISAEVYKTVDRQLLSAQNPIEQKMKSSFKDKNYGKGVEYWGYISIVNPPKFYDAGFLIEIKKYSKKKKEVEFRLRIDYDRMLKADEKEAFRLVCNSILRSVDIAENELKINDFDFQSFRTDLQTLFRKEGWI